jgi:3-oxoacyl-[acyl-carrier-protein] synthase II
LISPEYIVIRGYGSISALGADKETIALSYKAAKPAFQVHSLNNELSPAATLHPQAEVLLNQLKTEKRAFQTLDRSVLMAIYAARQAVAAAGWENQNYIGVNIGSSRGATGLFEEYLTTYLNSGTLPAHTSPVTTLGNISSWVANDLQTQGPIISHSVTCSTALQAIANGFAWLKAGMASKFLAGGAEAPLTPFTIAQMKAIGIYSADGEAAFPCRPHNPERKNTFVLGEGAAVFALEKSNIDNLKNTTESTIILESIGFGFETISSKTGISKNGLNFQLAIRDALNKAASGEPIDLVVLHSPGTVAGDSAELHALQTIFGENNLPVLSSNKFLTGHTLGASAALSLEYAIYALMHQKLPVLPFSPIFSFSEKLNLKRILVTAAGFGGNAMALIIKKLS